MIEARLTELNYNEILMYLGHRGQEIPEELDAQIRSCMEKVVQTARPRLTYCVLPVENKVVTDFPLPGEDMKNLIGQSREVVLMAATLGPEIDRLLQRMEIRNMADALIMDACASTAIENVCNAFCEDLAAELRQEHAAELSDEVMTEDHPAVYLTDRFSPGYGDLPLDTQKLFCEKLKTGNRIGLTLTPSSLMVPRKSVTAIIGICDHPVRLRKKGCESCNMFRTCEFRKSGNSCYSE